MTKKEKAPQLAGVGAEKKLSADNPTTGTSDNTRRRLWSAQSVSLKLQDLQKPHRPTIYVCPPLRKAYEASVRRGEPFVVARDVDFDKFTDSDEKVLLSSGQEVVPVRVTDESCALLEEHAKQTEARLSTRAQNKGGKPHTLHATWNDLQQWIKDNKLPDDEFFFDAFLDEIIVKEPFKVEHSLQDFPRRIVDADVEDLQFSLSDERDVPFDTMWRIVGKYARERTRDSLQDVFYELPEWDGVPRAESIFCCLLGAPDLPIIRRMSYIWLMGAVERAFKPGSDFDYCLVLVGAQGQYKSRMCKALCLRPDLFGNNISCMGNVKQVIEETRGKHIIELAELASFKKSSVEEVKRFITTTEDSARPAYGRKPKTVKRRFVLVGTTNDINFLVDPTGNRRFFPIKVDISKATIQYDTTDGRAFILQCWAEVYHHWREHVDPAIQRDWKPYLTFEEEQVANQLRSVYEDVDPLQDVIFKYMDEHRRQPLNALKIAQDALGLEGRDAINRKELNRISQIMARAAGWEKRSSVRIDGRPRQGYVYTGPADEPDPERADIKEAILAYARALFHVPRGSFAGTAKELLSEIYRGGNPPNVTATELVRTLRLLGPELNALNVAIGVDETCMPYRFTLRTFSYPVR